MGRWKLQNSFNTKIEKSAQGGRENNFLGPRRNGRKERFQDGHEDGNDKDDKDSH